jgi:hypothetical protein
LALKNRTVGVTSVAVFAFQGSRTRWLYTSITRAAKRPIAVV